MSLTATDINSAIAQAIVDSADIRTLCSSTYSTVHSVYKGRAGRMINPPPEDCPSFLVSPLMKSRGEEDDRRSFGVHILLQVEDERSTETTDGNGVKLVEYPGVETLENLLDLAITAARGINNEIIFDDKDMAFETVEYWPLMVAEAILTVSYSVLIGGYEPTI